MARRAGAVVLRREDDERVLCEHCVLADTLPRRLRGLVGHVEPAPGEGIVLRPGWSIHTALMRYPIDVVFVSADQVVLRIVADLKPWRAALCRGAHDVVELASGECARHGLKPGDRLTWAARPELRPPMPEIAPSNGRTSYGSDHSQTRVLLGTRDDRFLRLARFLLTRNQFEVEATKRVASAPTIVERTKPDVVVIDATDSLGDAARAVAAIEALHPHVAVVVVCEGEPPRWTTGLKVTEKWEALETLPRDIRMLADAARSWS